MNVDDVARAVELLLQADGVAGEVYNCCDGYLSDWEVATLAKEYAGSSSSMSGAPRQPKHQICTTKLKELGLAFGGPARISKTVSQLVERVRGGAS